MGLDFNEFKYVVHSAVIKHSVYIIGQERREFHRACFAGKKREQTTLFAPDNEENWKIEGKLFWKVEQGGNSANQGDEGLLAEEFVRGEILPIRDGGVPFYAVVESQVVRTKTRSYESEAHKDWKLSMAGYRKIGPCGLDTSVSNFYSCTRITVRGRCAKRSGRSQIVPIHEIQGYSVNLSHHSSNSIHVDPRILFCQQCSCFADN